MFWHLKIQIFSGLQGHVGLIPGVGSFLSPWPGLQAVPISQCLDFLMVGRDCTSKTQFKLFTVLTHFLADARNWKRFTGRTVM